MDLQDKYIFLLSLISAHDQTPSWTGTLIGCSLAKDKQPLCSFSNLIIDHFRRVHSEVRCIIWAIQNSVPTDECCLYITTAPCASCQEVIDAYGLEVKYLRNWRGKTEGYDPQPVLDDLRRCLPNSPMHLQYWDARETGPRLYEYRI